MFDFHLAYLIKKEHLNKNLFIFIHKVIVLYLYYSTHMKA